MPGKMTNREFYHGTPERDAKTKVRGYVGMNNVRLVTIEYDGEYVDTGEGALLRSVARPSLRARGGLLTARRGKRYPTGPSPFLPSSTTSAGANSPIFPPRADAIGYVPNG